MVNWEKINQAKSLKELLQAYFPIELYEYTKKILLDEGFLSRAKKWPDAVLDFSPYQDLEIITTANQKTGTIFKNREYSQGEIRKINVSKNKKLKELIMPNQELEGILDLSANSFLEKINISNNLLNGIKVHGEFSQKLKGIDNDYLWQKHNKNKIHPVKDVIIVLLDMGGVQKNKQKEAVINEKSTRDLYEKKNQEFQQLKAILGSKLENDWQLSYLDTLLISQEQIIRLAGANQQIIAVNEKEFQKAQGKLKNKLSENEILKICQVKVELTKLEIELENLQVSEQKLYNK